MKRSRCRRRPSRKDNASDDLISALPDDIILHILSLHGEFKDVVRSGLLSNRWKDLWRSLPVAELDLDGSSFRTNHMFRKFITHVVSQPLSPSSFPSLLNFKCCVLKLKLDVLENVVGYACENKFGHLLVQFTSFANQRGGRVPLAIFNSAFLKHLALESTDDKYGLVIECGTPWHLPSLKTLVLNNLFFECPGFELTSYAVPDLDLFSMLVNLKVLRVVDCVALGIDVFKIVSQGLRQLSVVNYEMGGCFMRIMAPSLTSFVHRGTPPHLWRSGDLNSLRDVDIRVVRISADTDIDMFGQLREARYLTMNLKAIRDLSKLINSVGGLSSPFTKLECLKVVYDDRACNEPALPRNVVSYFLESSPCASIVMKSENV